MSQGIKQEAIDRARDLTIHDFQLTDTAKIHRWMLQGEWVDSPSMRKRFKSLFQVVLGDMKRAGYIIEKRPIPGQGQSLEYRIANPDHAPVYIPVSKHPKKKKSPIAKTPMVSREEVLAKLTIDASPVPQPTSQSLNGNGHVEKLPGLGMSVEVFMLALDDDGQVTLGIRSAGQCWMTRVEGYAETASA